MEKPRAIQRVTDILAGVLIPGFFGNLQIEIKNGELNLIRKTEALLPEEGSKHGRSDQKINNYLAR